MIPFVNVAGLQFIKELSFPALVLTLLEQKTLFLLQYIGHSYF